MRFYGRKKELELLHGFRGPFCIAMTGRRRVGKTRLIREAFPDSIYLFVSEEKSEKILASEWNESIGDMLYMPKMDSLSRILEYLLKKEDKVLFIDEVQNLEKINPAILSHLQRIIDENKDSARLIFCGSYVSCHGHRHHWR